MTTKDYQTRRPLRIFLSYFRPHRGLFLLDISCAFLIAVIDLAFPLISRTAMYHWLPDKQFSIFFTVMALVVAAFVLRAGLYFIVGYWGHTFGILVEADIRRDLFAHMQDLGFDFYDKNRTGQLMSRLTTDLFELTELAHHGPEDLFISLVTIIGALAVMFSIQWRLAVVVCCIIPIFLLVVMYRRRQMSQASPGRQAENRRHQCRDRVRPLRCPHHQGLRQRGSAAAAVRRGQRGVQNLQAQFPQGNGLFQRQHGAVH